MTAHTTLPRPEGHIKIGYDLMSPMNWGIVPADFHYFVYRDIRLALQAMQQVVTTLHLQLLEKGSAALLSDHVVYRGHHEVTDSLLPTRLRGKRQPPAPRMRYSVDGSEEARRHFGDWYEKVLGKRKVEDNLKEVSKVELGRRDNLEGQMVERAARLPEVASLTRFQKRAVVRHYSAAPSSMLDVSTDPKVAAFFATGGGSEQPAVAGGIGMLWAVDLNFLQGLFKFKKTLEPNGLTLRAEERRDQWGDNKQMFEEQDIMPVNLELAYVELPFRRPLAQRARFLSLNERDGAHLEQKTEVTWWSIIERRSFACAFIQDGKVYENADNYVTEAALLPEEEVLAAALKQQ